MDVPETGLVVTRAQVGIAMLAVAVAGCASDPAAAPTPPTSASAAPLARADVGPLFPAGVAALHICSASVVHSPSGNVIVTAAHCVTGKGLGIVFAPGYDKGMSPYGTWRVTGAYADAAWVQGRDAHVDVAFLTVAPSIGNPRGSVEQLVGAATLSVAPPDGTRVTATGYALGLGDSPLHCTAATTTTDGYPTLPCGPLPLGTSGAPWMATGADGRPSLVGVSGGLHQGGCTDAMSYSAPFTSTTAALLARASAGGPADTFPARPGDGC